MRIPSKGGGYEVSLTQAGAPGQSPSILLTAHSIPRGHPSYDTRAAVQAFPQFPNGGTLGKCANLRQKEVRQRHSGHGHPRLELAVQAISNIADMNLPWHVWSMRAYTKHVKPRLDGAGARLVGFEHDFPRYARQSRRWMDRC
jgi:hypothetical protein